MNAETKTAPLEWKALFDAMRANHDAGRIEWVETTEAMYREMLNVLPPARQVPGGFLVGEPWTHDDKGRAVAAAFTLRAGRYEACYMTAADFKRLVG